MSQPESPCSEIEVRDPCAVAFLVMLHQKPLGTTVSSKDVMEFYTIGKTRFHTAKNILLNLNLITEKKSGQHGFLEYELLPIDENGPPSENDHPLKLARSVQCIHTVLKHTVNLLYTKKQKRKGQKTSFLGRALILKTFLKFGIYFPQRWETRARRAKRLKLSAG